MNKNKYSILLISISIFFVLPAFAQKDSAKFGIKINGFVNSQLMYDTRQIVGGRETMLVLYPENKKTDYNGKDINANPSFNQLAMISRLSCKVWGPDAFSAKTSALLEGDFSGQTNSDNNGFRLRHAYLKLNWPKSELLIGQYWHPFDVPEMLPGTLSMNTGAPIHSFSRHIQMRFVHNLGHLKVIAVAASQRDYLSEGPFGPKSDYMRNAVIPNLHLQLHYNIGEHLIGAGVDYKILQPRNYTVSKSLLDTFQTDTKISSMAFVGFARLNFKKIDIKLQGIWGENLSEHTMLGGYYEKSVDTLTGEMKYENSSTLSAWLDISTKGTKWKLGLFAGYTKNLGFDSDFVNKISLYKVLTSDGTRYYGRGNNIDYVYRIAPRITYSTGQMVFGSEFEYTAIAYGTPDIEGKVENTSSYNNFRVLLSATYNF